MPRDATGNASGEREEILSAEAVGAEIDEGEASEMLDAEACEFDDEVTDPGIDLEAAAAEGPPEPPFDPDDGGGPDWAAIDAGWHDAA